MTQGKGTAEASLERLASALTEQGTLTSDWLPAFKRSPRNLFIPDLIWPGTAHGAEHAQGVLKSENPAAWWDAVASDIPITTQWDDGQHDGRTVGKIPTSSNSMPTMVFSMLNDLAAQDGHKVLEVGTGTGWNAALLAARLGAENVTSVEVDTAVHEAARKAIENTGLVPTLVLGDGADGYADHAPYDRLIATASTGEIPRAWIDQVKPGGIIVTPWWPEYGGGAIVRLVVNKDGTASGRFTRTAAFMRLRQQRRKPKHVREYMGGKPWPADGARSMTELSPEDIAGWLPMFAIGLQTRGVFPWAEEGEGDAYALWLRDTAVTSWATADYEPEAERFTVYQSGPRGLWDEVEAAHRWWVQQGRPGFDRFGLTVARDGRLTAWLDSPDRPVPCAN